MLGLASLGQEIKGGLGEEQLNLSEPQPCAGSTAHCVGQIGARV